MRESISENKPLECIGYYLPGINFTKSLEGKRFEQPVYFNRATFSKEVDFRGATFNERAYFGDATFSKVAIFWNARFTEGAYFILTTFSKEVNFGYAKFSNETNFSGARFLDQVYFRLNEFKGKTFFTEVTFEQQDKVKFDNNDLSNVSFADSDITRIRFGDKITWGLGKKAFTIIEEEWLADKRKKEIELENVSLELVLSVYRKLRENYEYRLRYDDAGKFFIKEMELKRRYREIELEGGHEVKKNGWLRRHFSLTGLYYHFSRYGESIVRPAAIGVITLFLSTLFWVTQSNPILEPQFPFLSDSTDVALTLSILEWKRWW